jgi:EmrB/QacA subfamily drug resistance transporter
MSDAQQMPATQQARPTLTDGARNPLRWRALTVLGLFQFILVLDLTVVNVALPRIHDELGFTDAGLAWVVNAYVLTAAGLLLLGGRLADILGQRRIFLLGVIVFAVGSLACGAALSPGMLVGGRFVQGLGEALAAPAALGLIVLLFQDPRERMKALGIWGGLSGLGGVSGSVISGLLTDLADWRFIFLVNLPIALVAIMLVPFIVGKSRAAGAAQRVNFTGAVLGTLGLIGIVFGLLQIPASSWGSPQVLGPLLAGIGLVGAMLLVESRSSQPLIPARFFADRVRAITYVAIVVNSAVFFSYVFLLTLFEQQVLGFTPLQGGLSYLPLGFGIGAGLAISTALMPRAGSGPLLGIGLLGVAGGLLLSSDIDVGSSYAGGILPGMIVLGVSSGVLMPAAANAAFHGIADGDASLASAVQNVMAQVGGALGLAALVALSIGHARTLASAGAEAPVALTGGYALAFQVGAALVAVLGLVSVAVLRRRRAS